MVYNAYMYMYLHVEVSSITEIRLSDIEMGFPFFRKETVGRGLPLTSHGKRIEEGESAFRNLTTSGSSSVSNCIGPMSVRVFVCVCVCS